jgi:hypothetical protein
VEESFLEEEPPASQPPEEAYALPVLPPVAELPDVARVSALDEQLRAAQVLAYSAVPQAGARCAQAAQRVWFQDGSAPAVVSPEPEQADLPQDALARPPGDSAQAVLEACVRYAQAVPLALPVQQDGSVALPPGDSPQDVALVLPPDDWAAPPEQRAARSQQAAPDGSPADSQAGPVVPQADQVAQQQADSSACP